MQEPFPREPLREWVVAKHKPPVPPKAVWRISEDAPLGEWVDPNASVAAPRNTPAPLPEVSYGSWITSSYDLLDGTEIVEDDASVPGELFDELFGPVPGATAPKRE